MSLESLFARRSLGIRLGLETVRGLAAAGMRVIAGCRDARAATVGEGWTLDLARLSSVRAFAARALAELPRLDVLVCNAAVPFIPQKLQIYARSMHGVPFVDCVNG